MSLIWRKAPRLLMHWISALLVLPAAAYAGLPFYRSAWGAVKAGTLNMDVPISLAVILACAMSLLETMQGAMHTYYDAAVMLLFFLLIGRYLDRKMRNHARGMAQNLMSYRPHTATLLLDSGRDGTEPDRDAASRPDGAGDARRPYPRGRGNPARRVGSGYQSGDR